MRRVVIAVIHNRDQRRLAHILPASRALAERTGAVLLEVFEQPAVRPHGFLFVLYRRAMRWKVGRAWDRYRGVARPPLVRQAMDYVIQTLGRMDVRSRRASAVEIEVAAKHVRAWRSLIEGGGDYLAVLEDDAVFLPDTADRFCALVDGLADRDAGRLLYIDLAGGFDLDSLGITGLIDDRRDGFLYFRRPVTNTACGYLIDRQTARRFCEALSAHPRLRCLAIDWIINAIMLTAVREGSTFDCRHCDPPLFDHGSMTGSYESWTR